jgi:hypothetical protein
MDALMSDAELSPIEAEVTPPSEVSTPVDADDGMAARLSEIRARLDGTQTPAEEPPAPDEPKAEPTSDQPEKQDEEPAPETPAIARPASWSADKDTVWSSLTREAQEYVAQREAEAHGRLSQYGRIVSEARPLLDVVRAYPNAFGNVEVAAGLNDLLALNEMAKHDPRSVIEAIADRYNVDLRAFSQQTSEEVRRLQRENAQFRAQYDLDKRRGMQTEAEKASRQEAAVHGIINKWAADKEYYRDVEGEMYALIAAAPDDARPYEERLQDAYDRAVWAHPGVRGRMQAAEAEKRKAAEAERKRHEDAKRNRTINAGTSGVPTGLGKFDMDDDSAMRSRLQAIRSR